jgi:hypothetical protein
MRSVSAAIYATFSPQRVQKIVTFREYEPAILAVKPTDRARTCLFSSDNRLSPENVASPVVPHIGHSSGTIHSSFAINYYTVRFMRDFWNYKPRSRTTRE